VLLLANGVAASDQLAIGCKQCCVDFVVKCLRSKLIYFHDDSILDLVERFCVVLCGRMDLLKSIAHPEEVYALLKYKFGNSPTNTQGADMVGALI